MADDAGEFVTDEFFDVFFDEFGGADMKKGFDLSNVVQTRKYGNARSAFSNEYTRENSLTLRFLSEMRKLILGVDNPNLKKNPLVEYIKYVNYIVKINLEHKNIKLLALAVKVYDEIKNKIIDFSDIKLIYEENFEFLEIKSSQNININLFAANFYNYYYAIYTFNKKT